MPRDTKYASRRLVHWTGQALVPNVDEHVISALMIDRGPYQSLSSVTAIQTQFCKVVDQSGSQAGIYAV